MLNFKNPPKSVCLFRLSAIGDVIHTLPILRTLQATWPDTRFTWVIGKLEASLIGDIKDVEFIIFDKSQGRKAYQQLKHELADRKFDVLLMLQAALRASIASRAIKATHKIGFDRARAKDLQWLFSNEKITAGKNEHVMDGLFGFCEALGIKHRVIDWNIPLSADVQSFASDIIQNKPSAILSPCSSQRSRNFRNWSIENYSAVINNLLEKNYQVILTGGPTELEKSYAQEIMRVCDSQNVIDLIGKTSLKQLYALIKLADLVIAPDSGPIHMANSAQTPCIGLYASSNPLRTGPYHFQDLVVNKYSEAAVRYLQKKPANLKWGQRVRDPNVMNLITVQNVIDQLDKHSKII